MQGPGVLVARAGIPEPLPRAVLSLWPGRLGPCYPCLARYAGYCEGVGFLVPVARVGGVASVSLLAPSRPGPPGHQAPGTGQAGA